MNEDQYASREQLDKLLADLERDIPSLRNNMNLFFHRFEDRAAMIQAIEAPADTEYVQMRLEKMLRDAGIQ